MLGIGTALVGLGIDFVKDMISDHGEDLVKEGIKKVTGVDLNKKKPEKLTPAEVAAIKDAEIKLKELDFKELQLELQSKMEDNRHEEAKYSTAHTTYRDKNDMADEIATQIIYRNLPIIAILVIVNVCLVYFLEDRPSLIAIASNIIGVAVGNLFSERQAIVNFFYGSSIGSREKEKAVNRVDR